MDAFGFVLSGASALAAASSSSIPILSLDNATCQLTPIRRIHLARSSNVFTVEEPKTNKLELIRVRKSRWHNFLGVPVNANSRIENRRRSVSSVTDRSLNTVFATGQNATQDSALDAKRSDMGIRFGEGTDLAAQRDSLTQREQILIEKDDANKPSLGERARTLAQQCTHGTLTTSSLKHEGWPFGSLVDYILDDRGRPIFLLSYFASHTANIKDDSRCSLFLHPPASSPQADARVTLLGRCTEVPHEEIENLRTQFLASHQHFSEVENFNNFVFYRMDIAEVYYVAGFGSTARWVYSADYADAHPDPLMDDQIKMVSDINKNRPEDVRRYATCFAGLQLSEHDTVVMKSIDRLGFDIRVVYAEDRCTQEIRIPFKTPDGGPVTERLLAQSSLVHMALEAWEAELGLEPESPCPTSAPRTREAILSFGNVADSEVESVEAVNSEMAGVVVNDESLDINAKLDKLLAEAVDDIKAVLE